MSDHSPDQSDASRCISVHWSLPVQCVLSRAHRENWHETWHPESGNRLRYRYPARATEELHHGAWHAVYAPGPARPLDCFTIQHCDAGEHADWAVDSENTHACPWCEVERLTAELAQARTEPIIARWTEGVVHHDAGTTVQCVDADDPLRGIALELTVDGREALGLMLLDPKGEMDQADDGDGETMRTAWNEVREALIHRADARTVLDLMDRHDRAAIARHAADTTSKEAAAPLCRCGHHKKQHSGIGPGQQCEVCPGDDERSWRHPYTPEEN
jgi:hypothetical protein